MILKREMVNRMQCWAFAYPLTQARGASKDYFAVLQEESISIGLTVNK